MRAPTPTPTPTPILTPKLDEVALWEAVAFVEAEGSVTEAEDVPVEEAEDVDAEDVVWLLVFVSVTLSTEVTTAPMVKVDPVSWQQPPLLSLSQQYTPDPSSDLWHLVTQGLSESSNDG